MRELFTFGVKTEQQLAMVDITREVQKKVSESGIKNGICFIFIPHNTAAITINENSNQDVIRDFLAEMKEMNQQKDSCYNKMGNSLANINASSVGFSEFIIIEDGRLNLGTWQSIYFIEFDGPEIRKVMVKIVEG